MRICWTNSAGRLAEYGRLITTFVVIISLSFPPAFVARTVIAQDPPPPSLDDSSYDTIPLWVEPGAKVISTPAKSDGKPIKIQWLLKVKEVNYTIALFMIKATLDLSHPNVRFRLEARDGFNEDSPLIGFVLVDGDVMDFNWNIDQPLKARSGFFLLQFVNEGTPIPQFHFSYFICGGIMPPTAQITTPYFPQLDSQLFDGWGSRLVDCEWKLKKTNAKSYGCLMPVNVTNDCLSLYIRSNSSMKVYERIPTTIVEKQPKSTNFVTNSTDSPKFHYVDRIDAINSTNFINNDYIQPICGDQIEMIVFEGKSSTLRYYSYPRKTPDFIGDFRVVSIPRVSWDKGKKIHWIFAYCNLIFFAPIGIVIGMGIICWQGRDHNLGYRN